MLTKPLWNVEQRLFQKHSYCLKPIRPNFTNCSGVSIFNFKRVNIICYVDDDGNDDNIMGKKERESTKTVSCTKI